MATFTFETITAAQALAIGAADTLTFARGDRHRGHVPTIYQGERHDRPQLRSALGPWCSGANLAKLARRAADFADGSQLYVGDASANHSMRCLQRLRQRRPTAAFAAPATTPFR